MRQFPLLIDGQNVHSSDRRWIESFDPTTARPWAQLAHASASDVKRAVAAAKSAFAKWSTLHPSERGRVLAKIGSVIRQHHNELSNIEVRDVGKRRAESLQQIAYIADYFEYFAGLADKIEGAVTPIDRPGILNFTRREPLGVVAAIIPWNSPLMIFAWKVAPALAAGNTVVVKPSELGAASVMALGEVLADIGIPPGVINIVSGFGEGDVGELLVRHPDIAKVSFTGSETGGRKIAAIASNDLKRLTLELGGKSPQLVLEDADLDLAASGIASGIFGGNGQSCVAGSRLLVQDSVHDRLVERLVGLASELKFGDPTDASTTAGPIANSQQYERILDYIAGAKKEGAICTYGGDAVSGLGGWFIKPAIFTGVQNSMKIAQEEVFGPVLCVIRVASEEEMVRVANDSVYGLAAGIWTRDIPKALELAARIQAGTVYINNYKGVSKVAPVGGFKRSGYGIENGLFAIEEYLQTKSIWLGVSGVS